MSLSGGRIHYAIDPMHGANQVITDLLLAPRNKRGEVVFSSDFLLLKPLATQRGNGVLLYDVNNRGNAIALSMFNDGSWSNRPSGAAAIGNEFLLQQGYSILWSAWNWDVVRGNGRLQIALPVAMQDGGAITGRIVAEITTPVPADSLPVAWGGSRGYHPAHPKAADARLTVRATPQGTRRLIPRRAWRFEEPGAGLAGRQVRIRLDGGFRAGLLYELVYEARDPVVVGFGLAAVRDALSFFRYEAKDSLGVPNPVGPSAGAADALPKHAIIYGFSQSARVIQHMLLLGLHRDEQGRPVFDGAFVHGPGAGKGSFNHRFAQTTRHPSHFEDHLYPADFFPFATTLSSDPQNRREGRPVG